MISLILSCLIGLLILILESTALHAIALQSVMPNLTLLWVVSCGLLQGKVQGRRLGLILGLLQDLLFCPVMGLYGAIYFLLGHAAGCLTENLSETDYLIPFAIFAGSDLIYGLISYVIYGFFRGQLNIGYFLIHRILPEMIYTLMFSTFLYPLNKSLFHRFALWNETLKLKARHLS